MKKKKTTEKVERGPMHVAVGDPETVRRTLLEGARQSIVLMQRRERLEKIRDEKKSLFETLRILLKEMNYLNNKISQAMPKMKIGTSEVRKEAVSTSVKIAKQESSWQMSRIDELESELKEIEGRIKSLK